MNQLQGGNSVTPIHSDSLQLHLWLFSYNGTNRSISVQYLSYTSSEMHEDCIP